jgi:hypothetical protein
MNRDFHRVSAGVIAFKLMGIDFSYEHGKVGLPALEDKPNLRSIS